MKPDQALALLDDPVARDLLLSAHVASLAYVVRRDAPGRPHLVRVDGQGDRGRRLRPAAAERYMGKEAGQAFLDVAKPLFRRMGRIAITPEWIKVMDMVERFPSPYARAVAEAQAEA